MSSDIKKIINQAQFEIRNEKLSLIFKKNKKYYHSFWVYR